MRRTLAESPSGLVHLVRLVRHWDPYDKRAYTLATTQCGLDVNRETWTRIRSLDKEINAPLLGKLAMRNRVAKVELPTCDRCFK